MDPLTHTLVGANLSSTRLGAKSRLSAAAFVIGANLPDVDAILYFTGHRDLALGFRRGWTHGILALFVLPFVLTGLLMLYDRIRPSAERQVNPRWLLLLSALAILTHPFLDWLNNYGMRWLMPFRGTWSYGDSVYIMDPYLWLILGGAWLAGQRPSWKLGLLCLVLLTLLLRVVASRSLQYVPIVIAVAVVLFIALLISPAASGWRSKARLATLGLFLAAVYIAARLTIHGVVAMSVRPLIAQRTGTEVTALMVGPTPLDPLAWDVVARAGDVYRWGHWNRGALTLVNDSIPVLKASPEWEAAKRDPSIRGFITWVRFPWIEVTKLPHGTEVRVHDARYATRPGRGGFGRSVVVIPNR